MDEVKIELESSDATDFNPANEDRDLDIELDEVLDNSVHFETVFKVLMVNMYIYILE